MYQQTSLVHGEWIYLYVFLASFSKGDNLRGLVLGFSAIRVPHPPKSKGAYSYRKDLLL